MFERFTRRARVAVVLAQEEARELRSERIESAHLLVALAADASSQSSGALAECGAPADRLRERAARVFGIAGLDTEALATLGIDVDEVRRNVESHFGRGALDVPPKRWRGGHIPFAKVLKKSLELALREALHLGDSSIEDGHVLLGVIRADPERVDALLGEGHDHRDLRAAVLRRITDQAA